MSEIETQVKQIVVDHLGIDEAKVTSESKFIDDLGADSLDTVELVMAFEEKFNIENNPIEIGQKANITLFNPTGNDIFKEEHIISTSKNCAFINSTIQGKVYGVINNAQTLLK